MTSTTVGSLRSNSSIALTFQELRTFLYTVHRFQNLKINFLILYFKLILNIRIIFNSWMKIQVHGHHQLLHFIS